MPLLSSSVLSRRTACLTYLRPLILESAESRLGSKSELQVESRLASRETAGSATDPVSELSGVKIPLSESDEVDPSACGPLASEGPMREAPLAWEGGTASYSSGSSTVNCGAAEGPEILIKVIFGVVFGQC